MKFRTSLFLDRVFGGLALCALNPLARVLGLLLRRNHSADATLVKNIVVSKYIGLGSIVQSTPMLRVLKDHFPNATLTFLTSTECADFVRMIDSVDHVIAVKKAGLFKILASSIATALRLAWMKPDLFFDLEVYSLYASVMSVLSRARNRYGFYRRSTRLKAGALTHLVYFNVHQRISRIYLELAKTAGADVQSDTMPRGVTIDRQTSDNALSRFELVAGDYVVVNPNASELLIERRWPKENFQELIGELLRDAKTVVVTGSQSEANYVAEVLRDIDATKGRLIDTSGKTSLPELLALLKNADIVLTNDSGPMHLSVLMGAKTLALFGPGNVDLYGYDDERFVPVHHHVYCSPCIYETNKPPCGGDNICMKELACSTVLSALTTLQNGSAA